MNKTLTLAFFLLTTTLVFGSKVLVLNSSSDIGVYKEALKGFQQKYQNDFDLINLNEKKWQSADRVREMLYDLYPEIIYCIGSKSYVLANTYLKNRTLIFSSLGRVGDNSKRPDRYGVMSSLHPNIQLTWCFKKFPQLKNIVIFYSSYSEQRRTKLIEFSKKLNLSLDFVYCDVSDKTSADFVTLLSEKKKEGMEMFWVIPDPVLYGRGRFVVDILDECKRLETPVLSYTNQLIGHPATLMTSYASGENVGSQISLIITNIETRIDMTKQIFYPVSSKVEVNEALAEQYRSE